MNHDSKPLLIVGTGALATLCAARLAASGVRVILLGTWAAGLEALRTGGACIQEPEGETDCYPVQVTRDPKDCAGTRQALVLVKSWQTGRAANQLAACLEPDGLAVTLQNGLNNHQILVARLGSQRVALGVTTTGATLVEPGRVRVVGDRKISLGMHPKIDPMARYLSAAGFEVEIVPETTSLLWGKLVINAAINPLTAILRVPNGELLARPAARSLLQAAALETAAVAQACGIDLRYPDPIQVVEGVAQRTAANTSSMLSDVLRGTPTEIDAINGAVVEVGERNGIPTPINRVLWQIVKALEEDPGAEAMDLQAIQSQVFQSHARV